MAAPPPRLNGRRKRPAFPRGPEASRGTPQALWRSPPRPLQCPPCPTFGRPSRPYRRSGRSCP
eukprot:2937775-Alexandrium_andersonii.AAC.1